MIGWISQVTQVALEKFPMTEWNYRFFKPEEFVCPCCDKIDMHDDFMRKMVNLRMASKQEIIINSGFRCSDRNNELGGGKLSAHLEGKAADIMVVGKNARKLVGAAEFCGFGGIGINQKGDYNGRFIHVDTASNLRDRPRPWIWSY